MANSKPQAAKSTRGSWYSFASTRLLRRKPTPIGEAEAVTRYIRERGHLRGGGTEPKPKAFEPYRRSVPASVSAFRAPLMSAQEV